MTNLNLKTMLMSSTTMLLALILLEQPVLAETTSIMSGTTSTLTVSVDVKENPCKVNNNEPVSVEFGTVYLARLTSASKDVKVNITCTSEPADTLSLSLNGSASEAAPSALQTDKTGLGVQFYNPSGTLMKINTAEVLSEWKGNTTQTGSFNLTAKLVQQSGVTLSSGEFTASATLVLSMG